MRLTKSKHHRVRDARISFMMSLLVTTKTANKTAAVDPHKHDREFNMRLMLSHARDVLKTSDSRKPFERAFLDEKSNLADADNLF